MPDWREGFTEGEVSEPAELHWTDPSLQTPFTDTGPYGRSLTSPTPFNQSFGESDGGIFEGDKLMSLQEWANTPLSTEEYLSGRAEFGNTFLSAGPFTQERYRAFVDAGFPGVDFNELGGGGLPPRPSDEVLAQRRMAETPPPPWMASVYPFQEGENLWTLTNRAKKGIKGWTSGGPDAPKILTPVEWDAMLPSEQEGLLGFLEYIGIPADDYEAMMKRQTQQVAEAFGLTPSSGPVLPQTPFTPFNYQPARQR